MKKNYLSLMAAIAANFIYATVQAQSAPCSDPGGGVRNFSLAGAVTETQHFYPGTLPGGTPAGAIEKATAGTISAYRSMTLVSPQRQVTIHPELPGSATGKVVLRSVLLGMDAPDAYLKIYDGATATGTPSVHITAANAASYLNQNMVFNGPATVVFESATPAASGTFDINIKYMTGDEQITSSLGNPVLYWGAFIEPDTYTLIDNDRTDGADGTPISIGYFDENKNFVSSSWATSDLAFCTDYHATATLIGGGSTGAGGIYPGKMIYTKTIRPDMNKDGLVNAADSLIAARILWIMKEVSTGTHDWYNVKMAVHLTTLEEGDWYGGLHGAAIAAVPSVPKEPVFSITATSASTTIGTGLDVTVNFDVDTSHPKRLKLDLPAGLTLSDLSGATYNAGSLEFAAVPAVATFKVTSASVLADDITVTYEEPGFWNIGNFMVYRPCTVGSSDLQDFIGISEGSNAYPNRSVEVAWTGTPTPVSMLGFGVSKEGQKALLDWGTASERNNKGFDIERSADGKTWNTVGFVSSKSQNGNSSATLIYDYTDSEPLPGKNYYRLKQQDLDGHFEYSKVEMVTFHAYSNIRIYPNPASEVLTIGGVAQNAVISIYNTLGQEVRTTTVDLEADQVLINVASLAKGTYYITVRNAEKKVMSRSQFMKY